VSFYQPVGEHAAEKQFSASMFSRGNKLNHFLEVLEC
jgi:hypothetical protein